MSPGTALVGDNLDSFPRMRGDEPDGNEFDDFDYEFSPYARG